MLLSTNEPGICIERVHRIGDEVEGHWDSGNASIRNNALHYHGGSILTYFKEGPFKYHSFRDAKHCVQRLNPVANNVIKVFKSKVPT